MPYTKNKDIYYETHGNNQNPCLVLISGLGSQLISWPEGLIEILTKASLYVVTLDNRDSGLSKHYDNYKIHNVIDELNKLQQGETTPPYLLSDMADDTINLLNHLNINKAYFAGISMGGMIAQQVAIQHPDRTLGLICIASTSSDPSLPEAKPEVMQLFFAPPKENTLENYLDGKLNLYRIYNHPDYYNPDEIKTKQSKAYQRNSGREGFKRQLLAITCSKPRTSELKKLQMPALIIHGNYDPAFQLPHGEQLAECIPDSKLVVIEKMGHGVPTGIYEQVAAALVNFCFQ